LTTQANYHLTTNDHIAVLEAELFNLRTRRPVHPQFNCTTRAQKARNTNVDIDNEEAVAAARAQQSRIKKILDKDATPPPQDPSKGNPSTSTSTQSQLTDRPEHPYWLAKDAAYSLPVTKNVGAQEKPVASSTKKPEPAYKTLPPIHDPLFAESVYKCSLDAPITITQKGLLSLSLEVQSQFRDSTITRRVSTKESGITQALFQEESTSIEETAVTVPLFAAFSVPEVYYAPDGSVTIFDPVETYY
jgi:hypothetical protein